MVIRGSTMKLCWEATGSGVMCEGSPYIYPPSKVAASRSNGSGTEKWRWSLSSGYVLGQLGTSDSTPRRGPVLWYWRPSPKSCVLCWSPSTWPGTGTSSSASDYPISLPLPTLLLHQRQWVVAGLAVFSPGSDPPKRRTTSRHWTLGVTASFCGVAWDGRPTVPLGVLFRKVRVCDVTILETDMSF